MWGQRSVAEVQWKEVKKKNVYRVGHKGKVKKGRERGRGERKREGGRERKMERGREIDREKER